MVRNNGYMLSQKLQLPPVKVKMFCLVRLSVPYPTSSFDVSALDDIEGNQKISYIHLMCDASCLGVMP